MEFNRCSHSISEFQIYNTMNKLSIFIAIITFAFVSQAQTKQNVLKGRITSDIGIPVANVKIVNPKDTVEQTLSDVNGLFTLFTQDPVQTLRLSKIGYPTFTSSVSNHSTFVELAFKPALIEVNVNEVVRKERLLQ